MIFGGPPAPIVSGEDLRHKMLGSDIGYPVRKKASPQQEDVFANRNQGEMERNMVTVYSLPACSQCDSTKRMMKSLGIEYAEVDVSKDASALELIKSLGYRSAPVVVSEEDNWSGFKRDKIEALVADDADSVFA